MADWDVTTTAPAKSADGDPWAIVSHEQHTPQPPADAQTKGPNDTGLSNAAKVGLGALAAGAGVAAAKYPEVRTLIDNLAARAGIKALETPLWKQAGLRTAQDAPVARTLAGASGREALQIHNADISRTIAANEAGIPAGQEPVLSPSTLQDATRAPSAVYGRVERALPADGKLDTTAQSEIQQAGLPQGGRMSDGSPDAQAKINALRAQLLDPNRTFNGTQMVNEMRALRQEGFTNAGSDDVSNQELGRAQLGMARAIEGHVGRNIPANSDVTLEQFLDARKTLAKNYTIQAALRGGDVDLKALARIQRADPGVLDGGTKLLADFGDNFPEVAGLPSESTRYSPPSTARDLSDISLKEPASWLRPAIGNLARRALVGDKDAALANASQAYPAREAGSFSPPPQAPPPKFGGYLPAPSMVNAGGGASTQSALESLGLTPDVQAAGLQHPATARLQALREQLSRPVSGTPDTLDYQGPQKWGDFSLAPQGPPAGAAPAGVPFEDVLEQGGTQGKPVAAPASGYRPAPQSPKGPNMRTPPGAPELTEYTPFVPSDAQMAFRNQQAADRLRKVAGDLRMEGPGGNEGSDADRLRAALLRRERGYADGGEVRNSSSPASPGVGGAVKDALAALRDYFVTAPQRRLQAEREGIENTVVDDTASHAPVSDSASTHYADGGGVPTTAQEEAIEQSTRALSDLVSLHENTSQGAMPGQTSQTMAGGGRVELMDKIGEYLEQLAQQRAAREADLAARGVVRPKIPLIQTPDPATTPSPPLAAAAQPPQNPLQEGFLTKPQAHADGGTVDDSDTPVRKLADWARNLNSSTGAQSTEDRARIMTNLASLVYGLDAQGKPALGGRGWTPSQGGTPAGVLDAIASVPHGLAEAGAAVSSAPRRALAYLAAANQASPIQVFDPKTLDAVSGYLPGEKTQKFWDSIDPQPSKDAAQRLSLLKQRMQKAAGVVPAQSLEDSAMDLISDPSMVVPMGAARFTEGAPAVSKLLNWGASGTSDRPGS